MVTQLLRLRRAPKTRRRLRRTGASAGLRQRDPKPAGSRSCSLESPARSSSEPATTAIVEAARSRLRNRSAALHRRQAAGAPGERVALEIYAVLNIDGNSGRFTYYGFTNAIEREFFEALLTVSSIGPRSAARAFSLPMSTIAAAIDRGDYALLKTLPGIGQQKARDIVAKLQGKVTKFLLIQDAPQRRADRDSRFCRRSAGRAAAARLSSAPKVKR